MTRRASPTGPRAADLLRWDGPMLECPMLEFVRAAVKSADLAAGVDLLRTRCNETSLIQGRTAAHEVWYRVSFRLEPQSSVPATLVVGDAIVNLRHGTQNIGPRLVKSGTTIRSFVRDPGATELSLANLEIFGWEILDAWLPEVEDALRAMVTS